MLKKIRLIIKNIVLSIFIVILAYLVVGMLLNARKNNLINPIELYLCMLYALVVTYFFDVEQEEKEKRMEDHS